MQLMHIWKTKQLESSKEILNYRLGWHYLSIYKKAFYELHKESFYFAYLNLLRGYFLYGIIVNTHNETKLNSFVSSIY